MMASWAPVNIIPATWTERPLGARRLKKVAPKIAWSPFCKIRLTAIVTMIMPNSLVPRRTNGV